MPKLLPPTVGERLSECGTRVEVWGIVSGADVTLEAGASSQTLTVNATATTFTVPALGPGAKVRARQRLGPDDSEWSNLARAEEVSLPPLPPAVEPSQPRCIQCLFAWGVAPGSTVDLLQGSGIVAGHGIANRDGSVCLTITQPPPNAYQTQTTTCGTASGQGLVVLGPSLPEIPPPKIVEPLFECQSSVNFQQLVPGASYEIFVRDRNGAERSLGTFCACTPNVHVNVPHAFRAGDRVKAIGSMENDRWQCHVRGVMSGETPAVPPDDRIKPVIDAPVWEGDALLLVGNQVEGGTITLMRKTNAQAVVEEELGSRPASKHPELPPGVRLEPDNVIWVVQQLCGVTRASDPVTVQRIPPTIPRLAPRKPIYACAEVVIVDNMLPGATAWLVQVPKGQLGPVTVIGQQKSPGTSLAVTVFPRPKPDHEVWGRQFVGTDAFGAKFGGASWPVPVEFREEIPPPLMIEPVRGGDTQVWCDNLLAGAHVRVFKTEIIGGAPTLVQIGGGTALAARDAIGVWSPVPDRLRISASQVLCNESRPSHEVNADASQACAGPPIYEPAKWNDGGFHQYWNNCYNYGCDLQKDNFAQPGNLPTGTSEAEAQCTIITPRVLSDGLLPCTDGRCHPCHHRVALVMAPGWDYHWFRQDADGMWSHKPSHDPATNLDYSSNPITNPETADRGPYTQFCGYFCVYKPKVTW